MKRIRIQFTQQHPEFGEVALNNQEVLPYHYALTGKLDRGTNATGYTVWDDDLHKFEAEARKRGHGVKVLNWACSCLNLGLSTKGPHYNEPEALTCARCGEAKP